MYTASLLSLYHARLIYGGFAGLCRWALCSKAVCCVWWALCSCSLGQHLFIITIFATHLFIQLCSHPMPLFAMVGLLASVIRLGIQAMIGSVASVIGCFLFWVSSDGFAAFLEGLPFVVLLSCQFLCHMGDLWWPTWPLLHCLPRPCRSAYHIALRTTLLYPTRLLGSMHCFCVHFGMPHQVFGFHALPLEAQCYTMPGSMHCCCGHIVIPCRVAGFLALLWWVYYYAVPGCWVPCTAARWTLL